MSLMDKIRSWFTSNKIPEETRLLVQDVDTPEQVLGKLDELLTQNEFKFKDLNREIERLEEIEKKERSKIASGEVTGRRKRNALLYIRRLRREMDLYENRLKIYDRNMNLHLNLIAKIQDMQAMEQRGMDESKIDEIIQDYEENYEQYLNAVIAGEASVEGLPRMTSEERELQALEKEIMAEAEEEKAATEEPVVEKEPETEEPVATEEEEEEKEEPVTVEEEEEPVTVEAEETKTEEEEKEEEAPEQEADESTKERIPLDAAMDARFDQLDKEIEELERELELE